LPVLEPTPQHGGVGFESSALRPGHPDFLDLPWDHRFEAWPERCARTEDLPRGESRHPVVFVNYDGVVYALKSLEPGRAEQEYTLLRSMQARKLPVVEAVGHLEITNPDGERSVLVTRYLDHSLPYFALFTEHGLARYRDHLLDALAGLLVQLHLSGVFWGDCSLNNTLFLRDAGTLNAYLVDAETSEVHASLDELRRQHELDLMEENLAGALFDLVARGALASEFPVADTIRVVRNKYEDLWREIQREEELKPGDRFAMEERIRKLNALGFSVGEVELANAGQSIRLRAVVTDRSFHRDLIHSVTGLVVQERQAQLMLNEIQQHRAWLSQQQNRSVTLSGAAHHWMEHVFRPTVERIRASVDDDPLDDAERYCELLEHKWYLSERARRDVGHETAVEDYLGQLQRS
jgi:hypothetical protein